MNITESNIMLEGLIGMSKETLLKKGSEYASDRDRLHNFKFAADLLRVIYNYIPYNADAFDALIGMQIKHIVSRYDLLRKLKQGELKPTQDTFELMRAKNGDDICYDYLFELLFSEKLFELQDASDLADLENQLFVE